MIFKTKENVQQFLIEINKLSHIDSIKDREYFPTKEEMTSFIKSRGSIVPKLKSFRKSQNGKENWRHNRYAMMSGIKKWHSSTDGKRFHRALGRYNATRVSGDRDNRDRRQESFTECNINELTETLKGLSSLLTHMYIELDFYHPVDEQVDLEILVEEAHPVVRRIEESLLKFEKLQEDDLDFLLRMIDPGVLLLELANFLQKPVTEAKNLFESKLLTLEVDACGSYLSAYEKTKEELILRTKV